MSTSLRDQLLKVGLINQQQANEADRHQQHHERQRDRQSAPRRSSPGSSERGAARGGLDAKKAAHPAAGRNTQQAARQRPAPAPARQHPAPVREAVPAARPQSDRIHAERVQADRLQAERKKAERKARFAEIKQLIEQNRLTASGEGVGEAYHFVDGAKIKRITVEAAARAKISSGEAVIVRFDGRYELLAVDIAQRVRERDERIQIVKSAVAEPSASDEAYAAFPVPDDLIW